MRSYAPRKLQVLPNLAPLVDVSLMLVVVFLALAPLFARPLPLQLPNVEVKTAAQLAPGQVVVRADAEHLTLNGEEVADDKLLTALNAALAGQPPIVILDAHPDLPYTRVVSLLEVFHKAGARSVGLAPDLSAASSNPAATTSTATSAAPAASAPAAPAVPVSENPTEVKP